MLLNLSKDGRLVLAIRSAMEACAVAKDWDVTEKLRTTAMILRKS